MASHSAKRNVHGLVLLDKPKGLTSNAALQKVKYLFNAKKAGHTGSLDPLASGMLPLCFGEATKLSQFLLNADKQYEVTAKLGIKTNTGDAEGEVISEKPVPKLNASQLEKVLVNFRGEIEQVPSMFSAIKHKGQPLYKLARQGIEVDRPPRKITIYELTLVGFSADELRLSIKSSKGTYVRTLVEDIGEELGCGAHVIFLRRLGVDQFSKEQMVSLAQLQSDADNKQSMLDQYLLPLETMVNHLPEVTMTVSATFYLQQGQAIQVPHAPTEGLVRLTDSKGGFLGVGEILGDGKVAPRRLIKM